MSDIFDCMNDMLIELDEKIITGREVVVEYCLGKMNNVGTQNFEIEFYKDLIRYLNEGDPMIVNRGCPTSYGLGVIEVEPCGSFKNCDVCWEYVRNMVVVR